MKTTLAVVIVCLVLEVVMSIDPHHMLLNRPLIDSFGPRERRFADHAQEFQKVGPHLSRVQLERQEYQPAAVIRKTRADVEPKLKKGEYICGGKVCKLEPVDRASVQGIMQYPVL